MNNNQRRFYSLSNYVCRDYHIMILCYYLGTIFEQNMICQASSISRFIRMYLLSFQTLLQFDICTLTDDKQSSNYGISLKLIDFYVKRTIYFLLFLMNDARFYCQEAVSLRRNLNEGLKAFCRLLRNHTYVLMPANMFQ